MPAPQTTTSAFSDTVPVGKPAQRVDGLDSVKVCPPFSVREPSLSSPRDCLQERDLCWFRDRSAAVNEPGLGSADETEDVLAEIPLLVEEVDAQRRVVFEKQIDALSDRAGVQLDPPGRPDRRLEQPRQGDGHPWHQLTATVRILGKENGNCCQLSPASSLR